MGKGMEQVNPVAFLHYFLKAKMVQNIGVWMVHCFVQWGRLISMLLGMVAGGDVFKAKSMLVSMLSSCQLPYFHKPQFLAKKYRRLQINQSFKYLNGLSVKVIQEWHLLEPCCRTEQVKWQSLILAV